MVASFRHEGAVPCRMVVTERCNCDGRRYFGVQCSSGAPAPARIGKEGATRRDNVRAAFGNHCFRSPIESFSPVTHNLRLSPSFTNCS